MVTAEEFLRLNFEIEITKDRIGYVESSDAYKAMIDFANMHVKAALKEADNHAKMYNSTENIKDSILNSYPESNIK